MESIVMIGSGGHALSCLDVINTTGKFKCVGYVDVTPNESAYWKDLPYLGTDVDYVRLAKEWKNFFLGVGQIESSAVREKIVTLVTKAGGVFPLVVSPHAYVSITAQMGQGTVIMHGAHVGPQAQLGAFNIINTKALIEHGVRTEDFVHVSTGAVANGDVVIGKSSFIGSNAVIRQSLKIPAQSFIQAGQFANNSTVGAK